MIDDEKNVFRHAIIFSIVLIMFGINIAAVLISQSILTISCATITLICVFIQGYNLRNMIKLSKHINRKRRR